MSEAGLGIYTKQAMAVLHKSRQYLTQQQYKTLRGQILSGDIEGAMRGLNKLMKCVVNM